MSLYPLREQPNKFNFLKDGDKDLFFGCMIFFTEFIDYG
jgi:hypothetical protein